MKEIRLYEDYLLQLDFDFGRAMYRAEVYTILDGYNTEGDMKIDRLNSRIVQALKNYGTRITRL